MSDNDTRSGIFSGDDPFALIRAWLVEAEQSEPNDPNAMALATTGADGLPSVRIVLLKEIEANGFVFYTNYESAKGNALAQNPAAAFTIHWKSLHRQVRARGPVEQVSAAQSDAYYNSRARGSRIGAWASQQSQPLASREALQARAEAVSTQYPGEDIPRPPHWGGYRIRPIEMEFWADGAYRMHDRFKWMRASPDAVDWTVQRLYP